MQFFWNLASWITLDLECSMRVSQKFCPFENWNTLIPCIFSLSTKKSSACLENFIFAKKRAERFSFEKLH